MCYEQRRHPRFIHADADAVARHSRLCHFKYRVTDAISIADAYLVVSKSFNGKVFSELAKSKVTAAQNALPVMVRIHLVDEDSAVLPAVTFQVGLRITVDIELAHQPPSINWSFPDGRSDRFAVPCHVARKADIY